MSKKETVTWGFVVKTNSYAGNFEREVCAWLTGQIGECGVGIELVDDSIADKFLENILLLADEIGCHRPVSVSDDNPNDLIIFFSDKPSKHQLQLMIDRTKTYNDAFIKTASKHITGSTDYEPIKFLSFELLEITTTFTKRTIEL